MPEVNFYVLQEASGQRSLHFACQLIDKAHAENKQVFVNTASLEEAERLDSLLWTFRDDSFIPHQIGGASPVTIGFNIEPANQKDLLINLNPQVPAFYKDFKQVIEIVFSDPVVQQLARERYKYYRDQGLQITTHKS